MESRGIYYHLHC